ncbi:hypothetical protein G4B88_018572 [Cannabis sativa]|uniref:Uncharacterized protein n=1 Tax=Cannabis sativa TaxID=3483 RepID=A0A7J6HGI8_CANSA|nr:hypothetical protein G4B88_018572 [Cannabis sativa]
MQWLYEVFPGSNGIERTSIRIATNCYSAQAIIPERNKLSPELVKGRSIFLIIHNRGQLKQEGTKLSSVEGEVAHGETKPRPLPINTSSALSHHSNHVPTILSKI